MSVDPGTVPKKVIFTCHEISLSVLLRLPSFIILQRATRANCHFSPPFWYFNEWNLGRGTKFHPGTPGCGLEGRRPWVVYWKLRFSGYGLIQESLVSFSLFFFTFLTIHDWLCISCICHFPFNKFSPMPNFDRYLQDHESWYNYLRCGPGELVH